MLTKSRIPIEVKALANILLSTPVPKPLLKLAELSCSAKQCQIGRLQYNQDSFNLLGQAHEYVVEIGGSKVELSLQLYLNVRHHYRLFVFSRCETASGMLFSLNFTTQKGADGMIALSQRLRFAEGRRKEPAAAHEIRKAKTRILADILLRSGMRVTDNLEVELGFFDSSKGTFLDTTPKRFLSEFCSIAILKGHIQGNKGFQIGCLPRFDDSFPWKWDSSESVRSSLQPNRRGLRGVRAVPNALRYQVLERDRGRCCLCGRTPAHGVTLQIDHILPYSAYGLTVLSNLQTLCNECNLGKSNKSQVKFG